MRPPRRPLRWPSALTRQAARCSPPQRQPPLLARPPSFPPRWTICAPRLSVCTCPHCRRSGCRRCPPGWCCLPPRNGQNSLRGGSFPPLWAASTTPKTSVSCRWSSTLRRRPPRAGGRTGQRQKHFCRDTAPRPRAAVHARRPQYLRAGLHIPPHSGLRGLPPGGRGAGRYGSVPRRAALRAAGRPVDRAPDPLAGRQLRPVRGRPRRSRLPRRAAGGGGHSRFPRADGLRLR